ncbi:MAG TPA: enoyl-CoA hydratase [Pedomonas sp.]|nr:enoyl-CoA hydratase [Pedomonas sp.]
MSYETLIVERRGAVGLIRLNRPEALNALSFKLTSELTLALRELEADEAIGCMVLTGSEKAFAAGADIKEMATKTFAEAYSEDFITSTWEEITRCRKPILAAVNGFALGGGCEFAMMCDTAYAGENAKFSQPEIKLGVSPGAGGTQRLTRFVGKARAMDLCLTGRMINAQEALEMGLVARVFPTESLVDEVLKIAAEIAELPRPTVMAVKEMVNRAYETTLSEGLRFERRLFQSLFGTDGQKEGMAAFLEKRKPDFNKS